MLKPNLLKVSVLFAPSGTFFINLNNSILITYILFQDGFKHLSPKGCKKRKAKGDQKSNMLLFPALWQKPECKQPKASEAAACKVLYVRTKRDGRMEQRDKKWDVRDRIKYNPLSTLNRQRKDKHCQVWGYGLRKRKRYKLQVTSLVTPYGQPGASHKVSRIGLAGLLSGFWHCSLSIYVLFLFI